MAVRVQAFRGAPTLAPKRITVPKAPLTYVPVKQVRPAMLQSEFISPVASIKGLCSSFTNFVLSPFRSLVGAARRLPLLVEANRKKGLGCTLHGTRRKRARVSGFRARMSSPGGKKVLAARRKRGRKILCPASVPKRKV